MASQASNTTASTEVDDSVNVEDIEQLCNRMSKYDPCFRLSLIQHHLKRMGISCTDERLVKLFSLSFETMVKYLLCLFYSSTNIRSLLGSFNCCRLCSC